MAFNIESFKSNGLVLGGARPSLFRVKMTFPTPLTASIGQRQASYLIKAAALPAATIGEIDVSYFGRKIKLAGDRTFSDWTITVLNDEDFKLRNAFEEWSNAMNAMVSNRLNPQYQLSAYKVRLTVEQFGKSGPNDESGVIRAYDIVGAFPTNIAAITLDWDRNNTIEEFDVTFAYDYWEPLFIGGSLNADRYGTTLGDDSAV